MTPEMLTSELNRIPPPSLAKLKQDLGMPDKDLTIMTPEEKVSVNTCYWIVHCRANAHIDAARAVVPSRDQHETAERSRSKQHAARPAWTECDAAPIWTAERTPATAWPPATTTSRARPAATWCEEEQYIPGTRGA